MTPEAYIGERRQGRLVVVRVPEGTRLTPDRSLELTNHSPSGFEVGYCGSGPAQLALAVLLDYTGDEAFALNHYQAFKTEVATHGTRDRRSPSRNTRRAGCTVHLNTNHRK
jgi:hypothetical protein